jgi:hypothetical protein
VRERRRGGRVRSQGPYGVPLAPETTAVGAEPTTLVVNSGNSSAPALGVLLIAERTALLSGRDDEFVAVVTQGFTGIRWGELVVWRRGTCVSRLSGGVAAVRTGQRSVERCPPKDGSRRPAAVPDFLAVLLSEQVEGTAVVPCRCHGFRYVFRGHRATKAPRPAQPVPVLADPWPGIPVRGRGTAARADACWLPVAAGLTPHGPRHT